MIANPESQNITVPISLRVVALVLAIFVGGLVSGIIVNQRLTNYSTEVITPQTLELTDGYVCVNNSLAEAMISIVNEGEQNIIVRSVVVRGIECNFSDVYYWKTEYGPPSSLEPTSMELFGASFAIVIDGTQQVFQQASNQMNLPPHWTLVLYIKDPGNISANNVQNIPERVTISILTDKQLFYTDATVTYVTSTTNQAGIFLKEDTISWPTGKMVIYVRNTGTSDATIDTVYVGTTGNLTLQTGVVYAPSSKIVAKNGGTIAITVNYTWTSKTTYSFRIAPVAGNTLSFEEEAP
jgi:hypothetical protein